MNNARHRKPDGEPSPSAPAAKPLFARIWRRIRALVYHEQVSLLIATNPPIKPKPLGEDYFIKSPEPADYADWVTLLNTDEGFGRWDEDRLSRDLIAKLLRPGSAVLMYHQDKLIGCAAMCIGEFKGRPMPTGMFLIMDVAYRGQFKLSNALYNALLQHAADAGYEHIYASTFPDRLSALTLYLANDSKPVHTNLWSFVQWRNIHRRTDAIVARLTRRL